MGSGIAYAFDHDHGRSPRTLNDLLGGKGANLAEMTSVLRMAVPPGFTFTTEACRSYLADGWSPEFDSAIDQLLGEVEVKVGRRYGDRYDPLLLSVRSGAPRSMPGMLDTVLNVGLNDETVKGLAMASGDESFASDSYQRLRAGFADIVAPGDLPACPREQLRGAIEAVFRSWNGDKARAYRARERIDDHVGTAVNVQAMVFGNLDEISGTGVVFTRDPSTGAAVRYGEFLARAQGEDVVGGTHRTMDFAALRDLLPHVADELDASLDRLEAHYRDMCDVEFTVESGRLWILQTRVGKRTAAAAIRMAVEMAQGAGEWCISREEAVARVSAGNVADADVLNLGPNVRANVDVLGRGLPASPGVASGRVYFSAEDAVDAADRGEPVLLVREETSPADIQGMAVAAGILTSLGGIVSHAAVVARDWGIPAVVGAGSLVIEEQCCRIGTAIVREGESLCIDGTTGAIRAGDTAVITTTSPELDVLLTWADEISGGVATADPVERLRAAHSALERLRRHHDHV